MWSASCGTRLHTISLWHLAGASRIGDQNCCRRQRWDTACSTCQPLLIAVAVTLLLIRGIKESASFNTIIVIIKVLVVVLFIIAGIGYVAPDNILHQTCPADRPGCSPFMPLRV